MKTFEKQFDFLPRIAIISIAISLTFMSNASNAGTIDDKLHQSQSDMLKTNMPKDRVLEIPALTAGKMELPTLKPEIPANSPEAVRVTRNGKLVISPVTFVAKVTKVSDDGVIMFSDGHSVALRLPKGAAYALSEGDSLSVTYKPTTTAGTDEQSLELRKPSGAETKMQSDVLVAAIVQRGGDNPVVVDTDEFSVGQGTKQTVIQSTDSETTTAPDTYIQLKGQKEKISLSRGKTVTFKTIGSEFTFTLINSLHVIPNTNDSLSDEGANYWLEYVVTNNMLLKIRQ